MTRRAILVWCVCMLASAAGGAWGMYSLRASSDARKVVPGTVIVRGEPVIGTGKVRMLRQPAGYDILLFDDLPETGAVSGADCRTAGVLDVDGKVVRVFTNCRSVK